MTTKTAAKTKTSRARGTPQPSKLTTRNAEDMAGKGFVRAIDAARRIGVVPSTIYNWAREGLVSTSKRGAATFVSIETLLAKLGKDQCSILRVTEDPKTWS